MGGIAAIVAVAVLALVATALLFAIKLKPGTTFGTARFGPWPGGHGTAGGGLPAGLVLGEAGQCQLAVWQKEGHWLVVAPTGAGKSTSILAPSIKNWRGPLLAVDIKGELAASCAGALSSSGMTCVCIDPFSLLGDLEGIETVSMDPVALASRSDDPGAAFRKLAALLIDPPNERDVHWAESAELVTAGMVAAASNARDADNRGLAGVAKLADEGLGTLKAVARLGHPAEVEELLGRAIKLLDESGPNQRGAIMSTVRRQLGFLSSRQVRSSLQGDWDPAELVGEDSSTALFMAMPASMLSTQGRFLRVVTGTVVEALLGAGQSRDRRLLLAIDEAAALGRLAVIEQGIGLFRGYGATFLLSFQDDTQMVSTYGKEGAGTLRANCNAAYWAMRDLETCERVSAMIGDTTVLASSRDMGKIPTSAQGASAARETRRPLLTPDELQSLPADDVICFVQGHRPSRLRLLSPSEAGQIGAA